MSNMKKRFAIIGTIASVLLILAGIVVMTGFFGEWSGTSSDLYHSVYDSGFATFGADFYTYVTNNAYLAAKNVGSAVTVLNDLLNAFNFTFGISMICFGLGGFGAFGVVLSGCKKHEQALIENETAFASAFRNDPSIPSGDDPATVIQDMMDEQQKDVPADNNDPAFSSVD